MSDAVKKLNSIATANTSKLSKATLALGKIAEELVDASTNYEDLVIKTELKEQELEKMESEFKEKRRAAEVDLELSVKESAFAIINKVLTDQHKVAVDGEEYTKLRDENSTLKSEFDTKLRAEIGKAIGMETSKTNHLIKEKELEYKAKEAQNIATIQSQGERLDMLSDQVNKYEKQLEDERRARVDEAKARGNGAPINLSTAK